MLRPSVAARAAMRSIPIVAAVDVAVVFVILVLVLVVSSMVAALVVGLKWYSRVV